MNTTATPTQAPARSGQRLKLGTVTLTPSRHVVTVADRRRLAATIDAIPATPPRAKRYVTTAELTDVLDAIPTAKRRVRVYVDDFVPRSYRWAAPLEWIEARRIDGDTWALEIGRGDARRSHGRGTRLVVQ